MKLPLSVDKTPEGNIVKRAELFGVGYAENIEYSLVLQPSDDGLFLEYVGEYESYLEDHQLIFIFKNADKL